ncbi:MAG TPA: hypothetical protein VK766_08885 [Cytophagaceae bacterium]|jgi:hypothetical protein|nr:hypothetical protein [Cytophagaceae bacterium]
MKILFVVWFSLFSFAGYSQRKIHSVSQMDLIFSFAHLNSTSTSTSPVLRFSGFFNQELQFHYDFTKVFGLYSGLGLKNIGMINHFEDKGINLKQRAYALSAPLALKIGSMKAENYIAFGAELNVMTQYKQKFLYNNTKVKSSEWFSDKVNLINPAIFFQLKFLRSQVITVKYFLKDFLRYQQGGLILPDGTPLTNYGQSSNLFYISWGSSISFRDPSSKPKKQSPTIKTALLEE